MPGASSRHIRHALTPVTGDGAATVAVPGADLRPAAVQPLRWQAQLWQRMCRLFWLKLLGISAFMWVFFLGYFYTLRNPARPVQEMPLTALDHAIELQPHLLWAYVSLWLYVGLAPGLLLKLRELLAYCAWAAVLCATGLLLFYLFPTAIPKPVLPVDVAQHPGFAVLQGVDAAGNACPSLHVATALFTALWVQRLFVLMGVPWWLRAANSLWVVLIIYSTLAIKQHVVLDALGGAALGALAYWASVRWFPLLKPACGAAGAGPARTVE